MSRFARIAVTVPDGVKYVIKGKELHAQGPRGASFLLMHDLVRCKEEDNAFYFVPKDESTAARALAGTMHRLARNMFMGVNDGFEKFLELRGVGFRVEMTGTKLKLSLGFSHPVFYDLPDGVQAKITDQTHFSVRGIDKQRVHQVAAEIRAFRSPDPYKGKGVRYADETIILKETKKK